MALTIAIIDHAVKNLFTIVIGIPATTSLSADISKLKREFSLSMNKV